MNLGNRKKAPKSAPLIRNSEFLSDKRHNTMLADIKSLEQSNYALNVAKMQLWMSKLDADEEQSEIGKEPFSEKSES